MKKNILIRLMLTSCAVLSVFTNVYGQKHIEMRKSGNYSHQEIEKSFNEFFSKEYSGKGSGHKQFQRWLYLNKFNTTYGESTSQKVSVWNEVNAFKSTSLKATALAAVSWTELGPDNYDKNTGGWNPGIGRINTIAFHPTNNNIIYIGAPAGGLWRTTNGGTSWTPMTDKIPVSGVSAIAIDKNDPNIIYIGTGDKDNWSTRSIGMLKSTDGGSTWNTTGINWTISDARKINELVIHPNDSKIIYAATSSGLLKSTNSGASFTLLTVGDIDDFELKPSDPSTFYFVKNKSVYQSIDNGVTFNKTWGPTAKGRCLISVSPDAPNNVYLLAAEGFYRSTNNGGSFTKLSNSPVAGNSAWYMWGIAVSHTNANEIHVGEFETYVSTNGGSTWTKTSVWTWGNTTGYVHADIHKMIFRGGTLFVGSDGGIHKSSDAGANWTDLTKGLKIREFYRIGSGKNNPDKIVGGSQDNGTSVYNSGTWQDWLGADGMECMVSHSNQNIIYGTSQNGTWYKSNNGGANRISIAQPGKGNWVTPGVMHPTNDNTIFVGNEAIRKTTNGMASWTSLTSFGTATQKIDALAIAESNANYLYAAKGKQIWRSTNGGSSWTEITSGLGNQNVAYIAVNPNNANNVAISHSGFSAGNKVFVSTNGGSAWSNVSLNLPNLPARCIAFDGKSGQGLYVGMEVGVYFKDNSLSQWTSYFDNLPHCPVSELEVNQKAQKIRAATYGRGLWEAPLHGASTAVQTPYGGSPRNIPGTIEAEHYDEGGEGLAYHDITSGNSGNKLRTDDVDVETCSEGGFNVGWTANTEWMEYTVNVTSAGTYKLEANVASPVTTGKFRVEFNNSDRTGTMNVPNTTGYQTWQTISKNITLAAGKQVMKIYMQSNGFNINWVKLSTVGGGGLPSPWANADIGAVGAKGSATSAGSGSFNVTGSGADIWGSADEFHFVHQPASVNQVIITKVDAVSNTNLWAKAGVMFRDNTSANAKFVAVFQRPDKQVCMQWRTSTGGAASWNGSTVGGTGSVKYLKLERIGNQFTGSYSTNGSSYTKITTTTCDLANAPKVGLALTSHADGTVCTAQFTNVSVQAVGPSPDQPFADAGAHSSELPEVLDDLKNKITIYPNPAQDWLYINQDSNETVFGVKIYSISGKLIENKEFTGNNRRIMISNYYPGTYLVEVTVGDKTIQQKLIKQ